MKKILILGIVALFVTTAITTGIKVDFDEQVKNEKDIEINESLNLSVQDIRASESVHLEIDDEKICIMDETAVHESDCGPLGKDGLPMDHFAETGEIGDRVFHLWDLASAKPKNFPQIFARSRDPSVQNFRGRNFSGIVLYVKDLYFGKLLFTTYTGKISDVLTGRMYSQALTFQKRFFQEDNNNGESGINYWPVLGEELMSMKIYLSPSIENESISSLKIDYDVNSNKKWTQRPLIDEVRQIPNSNLYIGKMYYRLMGKPILFLWFAIEQESYIS
jgi:hypothetical protein